MLDMEIDEQSDFMDRIVTSIMTVILSLFLGIFRNYTFHYIVYMDSLFSNSLSQMPMTNYVNLNIFQNTEGIILLGISGAIQGSFANCNISVDLDLFNEGIIEGRFRAPLRFLFVSIE